MASLNLSVEMWEKEFESTGFVFLKEILLWFFLKIEAGAKWNGTDVKEKRCFLNERKLKNREWAFAYGMLLKWN